MYKFKMAGFALLLGAMFISNLSVAQTVMEKLKKHSQTADFAKALEDVKLDQRLNQAGPFTLFVPSASAFNQLSNSQKITRDMLLNHIFIGRATERSLKAMGNVTCLSGKTIKLGNRNNRVTVENLAIIESNIRADNGVIHIIDGVIRR